MWGRSVCEMTYQDKDKHKPCILPSFFIKCCFHRMLWSMEVLELASIHPYTYISIHICVPNYLLLKTSWCSFLKSQKLPWRKTQSKALISLCSISFISLSLVYWFNREIWVWRVGSITCLCFVSYYLKGCCFLILKKYCFNT